MPSLDPPPSLYAVPGRDLALSGSALREILVAVLHRGGRLRFRARGLSMQPDIGDGDVITVGPATGAWLRVGDVVVVGAVDSVIVHRVVQRRGLSYRVRGDNAWCDDGWFTAENVIGVVTCVEREGVESGLGGRAHRLLRAVVSRHATLRRARYACRRLAPSLPAGRRRHA